MRLRWPAIVAKAFASESYNPIRFAVEIHAPLAVASGLSSVVTSNPIVEPTIWLKKGSLANPPEMPTASGIVLSSLLTAPRCSSNEQAIPSNTDLAISSLVIA
ncbi:hypothetical protein SDC9_206218 [bioreactor metagenome]|uniref:Uncharacterized protein n=1 Tax=bioreactor metagenome TaxID=1076179 RepID=A0A645JFY8_9ZZZZ